MEFQTLWLENQLLRTTCVSSGPVTMRTFFKFSKRFLRSLKPKLRGQSLPTTIRQSCSVLKTFWLKFLRVWSNSRLTGGHTSSQLRTQFVRKLLWLSVKTSLKAHVSKTWKNWSTKLTLVILRVFTTCTKLNWFSKTSASTFSGLSHTLSSVWQISD